MSNEKQKGPADAAAAAGELARYGIRVNVICPGYIDTGIHDQTSRRSLETMHHVVETQEGPIPPTGHIGGRADQVAELVLFFASKRADHITGTEIYVDGAQSLLQC